MFHRWLDEAESISRDRLPPAVLRYLLEGARDEITLEEATTAWRRLRIAPRVLHDVREVQLTTTLLGHEHSMPLGIAPMTLQRAADPRGEVAMAAAAAEAGVPMVVSSNAGSTFADISATGVTWWLQAYLAPNRDDSRQLLDQAVAAGAAAVVLTVDTPTIGTRYRPAGPQVWEIAEPGWLGANATTTTGLSPDDREKAMDLTPDDIGRLGETTGLPVVVKGVLRPEDARRCVQAGAAAVWISNHGGRQLDQAVATADCVEPIRASVGAGTEIYVDGGVRNGLHALMGVSLGADAVFVGRPMFHALAADGQSGVARGLEEIRTELIEAMRLSGCPDAASAAGLVVPSSRIGP